MTDTWCFGNSYSSEPVGDMMLTDRVKWGLKPRSRAFCSLMIHVRAERADVAVLAVRGPWELFILSTIILLLCEELSEHLRPAISTFKCGRCRSNPSCRPSGRMSKVWLDRCNFAAGAATVIRLRNPTPVRPGLQPMQGDLVRSGLLLAGSRQFLVSGGAHSSEPASCRRSFWQTGRVLAVGC